MSKLEGRERFSREMKGLRHKKTKNKELKRERNSSQLNKKNMMIKSKLIKMLELSYKKRLELTQLMLNKVMSQNHSAKKKLKKTSMRKILLLLFHLR
jgi:hypothetical protein